MTDLSVPPAISAGQLMVPAAIVEVIDGDTARVIATQWPRETWTGLVRVRGIDTAELRGRCDAEKALALEAKTLAMVTFQGSPALLLDIVDDKYAGRVVASVRTVTGLDWAETLLTAGLAKTYDGDGPKPVWCAP